MNEATKRLNAEYREWLNVEDKKLRPLFDKMTETTSHWKNPFTAVIPVAEFDDYNAAAIFFTASPLVKLYTGKGYEKTLKGLVAVKCEGYYGGPAAG